MKNVIQLELPLYEEDVTHRIDREIERLNQKHERVRKSLYAKNAELIKMCNELKKELEFIKHHICQQSFKF